MNDQYPETDVTPEQIQITIDEAKQMVAEGDALDRLMKNVDFKELIVKGYFQKHAYQLVEFKAAPTAQNEPQQAAVIRSIDAIGELQQYFNKIFAFAAQARQDIIDAENELEAMAEDGEV